MKQRTEKDKETTDQAKAKAPKRKGNENTKKSMEGSAMDMKPEEDSKTNT